LLAEMGKWLSRKLPDGTDACIVKHLYKFMAETCYLAEDPDKGKSWYIRSCTAGPNTPADKQLEVLSGKHHRYQAFFCTEASGIPDPVFSPIDTTFTDPVNFMVLIWNPTRRSGFAYDTHFGKEREYWVPLHWSAEESDMVAPDQIEYLKKKYGRESPEYRVSVLGMPPEADPGSVIPYEWVHEAAHKDKPTPEQVNEYPVVFGVDVANQGEDKSVILVRQGPLIHEIVEYSHLDTVELAQWVMRTANLWEPSAIFIETNGLGVGVYDHLRRFGQPNVRSVNVARAPTSDKYQRVRDELWFKARERFQAGTLFIPNDAKLISELSTPKYEVKERGRIKVESKLDLRRRGIPSPNMADALIFTFAAPDDVFKLSAAQAREDKDYRSLEKRGRSVTKHSWMRV
jgi:phage terminase large subunit